jgi:hypothetical protein
MAANRRRPVRRLQAEDPLYLSDRQVFGSDRLGKAWQLWTAVVLKPSYLRNLLHLD